MITGPVRELYRLARTCEPDAFIAAALDSIRIGIAFDSAIIGVAADDAGPVPAIQRSVEWRTDPGATREWIDASLGRKDRVSALVRSRYWRAHRIQANSFFDRRQEADVLDYARRHGRENFLTTAIPIGPNSRFQWTSLYRARPDDGYDDDEVRACEALMCHFSEAFQINQAIHRSAGRAATAPGSAVALADAAGHLLRHEPPFLELLSREWAAADHQRLPAPVVESRAFPGGGRIDGRHVVVTVTASIGPIVLHVRPRSPIELLPRQRAIAIRLYSSGRTSKEIARQMQLSPATVRNHLAAAYRDLGIRSRVELHHLVMSDLGPGLSD